MLHPATCVGGVVARGNLAITSGEMSSTPDAPVSPPQLAERGRAPLLLHISRTEENAATIISSWGIDLTDGAGEGNRTLVRSLGSSYSAIELRPPGGERGIRTPDTLAGMHDFESCAFNQALPSLQNET